MRKFIFLFQPYFLYEEAFDTDAEESFSMYQTDLKTSVLNDVTNIEFEFVENLNLNLDYDLIIADDQTGNIKELALISLTCKKIKNIILCDSQETIDVLLNKIKGPKVMTLDFYFQKSDTANDENELRKTINTYKQIKKKWPTTQIVGISNYSALSEIKPLRDLMTENNDLIFDKVGIIYSLPSTLFQRIEYYEVIKSLGGHKDLADINNVDSKLKNLNNTLLDTGIDLSENKYSKKIATILTIMDQQEIILTFAKENKIAWNGNSLAGVIELLRKKGPYLLTAELLRDLYYSKNEKYGLPLQPRATIQKEFRPLTEGKLSTASLIVHQLLKKHPGRWEKTLLCAQERFNRDKQMKGEMATFIDNILLAIHFF